MGLNNWLQGRWDPLDQKEFSLRIHRAHGLYNKARYHRLKAQALFETREKKNVIVAIGLLLKSIKEFVVEEEMHSTYSLLCDCYLFLEDKNKALLFLKEGLEKNVYGLATSFSSLVIEEKKENEFSFATQVMKDAYENKRLISPRDLFFYHCLMALYFEKIDALRAKEDAHMALSYARMKNSGLEVDSLWEFVVPKQWIMRKLKKI